MVSTPRNLIVFGIGRFATMAARTIHEDTGREIVGFTVDLEFMGDPVLEGRPVAPFEHLRDAFDPADSELILPLGPHRMNLLRRERLEQARAMGFGIASWVSSRAIVPRDFVAHENVLVYEGAIVQHYAGVGRNVTLRAGANVGHHAIVHDHCFLATGVVTGGSVEIGEHSWIGLGAVIRDGVRVAPRSFIGAGAVVVADTEPDGVYVGVPARRLEGKTSMELTA